MSNSSPSALVARVAAVQQRLDRLATVRSAGLTDPEPTTGERWEAAQIWSHIAEFIPYWIEQCSALQTAHQQHLPPPQFGRSKDDAERVERIASGRSAPLSDLAERCRVELQRLSAFIEELPTPAWAASGTPKPYVDPSIQPQRGPMTIEQIVSEYILDHIDDHASQLAGITSP